jgi:GH15 family glucan-1,4-alpha-glucosidase
VRARSCPVRFWLAHAQAVLGDVEAAPATFEHAIAAVNDVGLLAEEVDPASRELIGNVPPAFSHIAWSAPPPGRSRRPPGRPS